MIVAAAGHARLAAADVVDARLDNVRLGEPSSLRFVTKVRRMSWSVQCGMC